MAQVIFKLVDKNKLISVEIVRLQQGRMLIIESNKFYSLFSFFYLKISKANLHVCNLKGWIILKKFNFFARNISKQCTWLIANMEQIMNCK